MRMQGHFGRNKKRYGIGLGAAAALAAPFAFQRFRGAAREAGRLLFTKGGRAQMKAEKPLGSTLWGKVRSAWKARTGQGTFRRTFPANKYPEITALAGTGAKRARKPAAKKTTRRRK